MPIFTMIAGNRKTQVNYYRIRAGLFHDKITEAVSTVFLEIHAIVLNIEKYIDPTGMIAESLRRIRSKEDAEILEKLTSALMISCMEYKKKWLASASEYKGFDSISRNQRKRYLEWADQEERKIRLCSYACQLIRSRGQEIGATVPSTRKSAEVSGVSLDQIVGLTEVKGFLASLEAQLRIRNERRKMGLPVDPTQTLHMIFMGNPGTGKTTVARYVSQLLHEMGVLKTNKLVETDRSGLIAGYVGQTALKTRERVEEALDGVLFIDEAYALANDTDSGGYGKEAIDTLVKCIDDYRDRLVVILAGYASDMARFLETNPGLTSRFPTVIDFPDYTVDELMLITERMFSEQSYALTERARAKLRAVYAEAKANPYFGNGRFVRILFEKALRNQAMRLRSVAFLTKELLTTVEEEDIG